MQLLAGRGLDTFRAGAVIAKPDVVKCEGCWSRLVRVLELKGRGWGDDEGGRVAVDLDRGKGWVLVEIGRAHV